MEILIQFSIHAYEDRVTPPAWKLPRCLRAIFRKTVLGAYDCYEGDWWHRSFCYRTNGDDCRRFLEMQAYKNQVRTKNTGSF